MNNDNFEKLKNFCKDSNIIAVRYPERNRWDLAILSGEWGYKRITSVSDSEINFVPWRLLEKRLLALLMELSFGA